jgi:hypothetical protein
MKLRADNFPVSRKVDKELRSIPNIKRNPRLIVTICSSSAYYFYLKPIF